MQAGLPTLTVAISTYGARAARLDAVAWPCVAGIDYLVLVQDPDAAPALGALAARADVTVVRLSTSGLSRSRNAALDHAAGDIVLVTDDDVTHFPETHEQVRSFFRDHPDVDLLTGRSFTPDGAPRKRFAEQSHALSVWNTARVSSHEIAFRRAPVNRAALRFDESFGVGAGTDSFLGEEYIFLADCLRAGLRGRYAPLRISTHPAESSGFVWRGQDVARARAAVIGRVFGSMAPVVRLAFAVKNLRRFGSRGDVRAFLLGR